MALYSFSSEPTSASQLPSTVPLGDLPLANSSCPPAPAAQVITPDDAERVQRIKTNGLASLGHGDLTWKDGLMVGAALAIITEAAPKRSSKDGAAQLRSRSLRLPMVALAKESTATPGGKSSDAAWPTGIAFAMLGKAISPSVVEQLTGFYSKPTEKQAPIVRQIFL